MKRYVALATVLLFLVAVGMVFAGNAANDGQLTVYVTYAVHTLGL